MKCKYILINRDLVENIIRTSYQNSNMIEKPKHRPGTNRQGCRRNFYFCLLHSSMHGNAPLFMIVSYWGSGVYAFTKSCICFYQVSLHFLSLYKKNARRARWCWLSRREKNLCHVRLLERFPLSLSTPKPKYIYIKQITR